MSSRLFPIFLDLSGRDVLIGGAGNVALQKARPLIEAGARLTLIAPDIHPELRALMLRHPEQIIYKARRLRQGDLRRRDLVILATDDHALHRRLSQRAREWGVWLNAVDEPENCAFYSAAIVERGPVRIAVSSSGQLPGLSSALRKTLEALLPSQDLRAWESLALLRHGLREALPEPTQRSALLKRLFSEIERDYFGLRPAQGAQS